MRFSQEIACPVTGEVLAPGQVKTYRDIFPMSGESWERLRLVLRNTVTIGTGADAIPLGGFQMLKGINLRTSRNEQPVSIPGMGLYYLNLFDKQVAPSFDPIPEEGGVAEAVFDIPFAFKFMSYADDLLLQTKRYSHIELELALGTIADLYETPGTASVVPTFDIILSRSKNPFLEEKKETKKYEAMAFIRKLAPFNPATQPYILIESAQDLALFGFIAVAHEDATPGVSFSGTPSDILGSLTFKDPTLTYIQSAPLSHFKAERNKYMGNSGADLTGIYLHLFSEDGSIMSAYGTYGVNATKEIRLEIGSIIGSPTDPQVDIILFGMRTLR